MVLVLLVMIIMLSKRMMAMAKVPAKSGGDGGIIHDLVLKKFLISSLSDVGLPKHRKREEERTKFL